ncbi:hypothetical protein [Paraglaciecola arctica]|uniref:hypothetical protein n=1 Tax=Paraglaciecola arctica TaxID=1128911 RepID=UPI001C073D9E|nr:hypothetical protein [Paraglaciecola arctica]MBU3005355.1 hypothetical protein [Paraglaciecola arctica]
MTVKREASELLNIPTMEVCDHVKKVLSENQRSYSYSKTTKNDNGFVTTVKPVLWPFILSTKMNISFVDYNEKTEVIVSTQSQWFILGDVFNAYDGYIRTFFDSLRKYS